MINKAKTAASGRSFLYSRMSPYDDNVDAVSWTVQRYTYDNNNISFNARLCLSVGSTIVVIHNEMFIDDPRDSADRYMDKLQKMQQTINNLIIAMDLNLGTSCWTFLNGNDTPFSASIGYFYDPTKRDVEGYVPYFELASCHEKVRIYGRYRKSSYDRSFMAKLRVIYGEISKLYEAVYQISADIKPGVYGKDKS